MIVPATPDNVFDLAALHINCIRETYTGIFPDAYLEDLSIEKRKKQWIEHFADQKTLTFLLKHDSLFVGLISLGEYRDSPDGETGEISSIYILKAYQGYGYGKKLLSYAEDKLKSFAYQSYIIWVLENNNSARTFYESQGLTQDRDTKNTKVQGVELTEVRYSKILNRY